MFKTKYPDVDVLILELCNGIEQCLALDFKGLYLFGSLVGGDFDLQKSDIDLLAITKNVVSVAQLEKLRSLHKQFVVNHPEWENRVEVAYVSADGMRNFKTKTNTIARISPGEELHFRDMNKDWLLDWHMVQEQGLTVYGPKPSTFIPHNSDAEYVQSIRNILPLFDAGAHRARHKGYQSYIVMSLCRGLYAIKYGKQVSKLAGARWAAQSYSEWAKFIDQATEWRGMTDETESLDTQMQTIEFVSFAMKEANKLYSSGL